MDKIRKRFNELMGCICWEHLCSDSISLEEMVYECKYILSMYCDPDCTYRDDYGYKVWKSDVGKLKRFIARYEKLL